ncbi:MAG: DUF354 domain-containing protein [Terriglobales bacterium]|jgi:hypothetical protein
MVTTEAIAPTAVKIVRSGPQRKIWIDLDNSPHVPFFRPIIEELRQRGYELLVTARDAYQVKDLLEFYGVEATVIGGHHGKHKILKAVGTIGRALKLIALVRRERPDLAVCHGSRGLLITSKALGIPALALTDYEFTAGIPWLRPEWVMVPSVVPDDRLGFEGARIAKYPGIKEDVYVPSFRPEPGLRKRLGISQDSMMILVRPPASEAHYHNPESEGLLDETLKRFSADKDTTIVLLPRNKKQEVELRGAWSAEIEAGRIVIPGHVEDGLNFIWNADLVISGGGTMNREAAAMGVPVYSIFRGKIGGVDRFLADQGRLVMVESVEDVRTKIKPVFREKLNRRMENEGNPTLDAIIGTIVSMVESKSPPSNG